MRVRKTSLAGRRDEPVSIVPSPVRGKGLEPALYSIRG